MARKAHPEAGQTFPEGEGWSAAGTGPVNGKTLAHLLGCRECREGFARAEARIREDAAGWQIPCDCYWCGQKLPHPRSPSHQKFYRLSDRLTVAESLDPSHRVQRRACETCGHIEESK